MNKLRNKVFIVIFSILTIFLISILCIFNYQNYRQEKNNIENNLRRMNEGQNKEFIRMSDPSEKGGDNKLNNESVPKIFMDLTVYTAILDNNYNVIDVINHTQNGVTDDAIKDIAEKIIQNKSKSNINIGNLYFDEYSYSFKHNNTLTIIDNTSPRERLIDLLKTSIFIFVLLEIIIIYISVKLTSWIIKPVIEAFDKQKQFIADASHELKTPISVIMASAEALDNEPNEKKWLNNIKSESERMGNLISDLLDMAKLESGIKEQYNIEDLSKIVERSVLTFESLIYEKNIKLKYDIEENIKYKCNGNQIKQVVMILLDNALKHTSSKGNIIVELKKDKNNIIIEVKNEGKEIPKEEREKIFERFYRIDESRNRNENRYGLGLAIAKNIILNHNGKISVNYCDGYNVFKVVLK